MKTRRIISVLRVVFERIALVAVMLAVVIYGMQGSSLYNFAQGCWPIVAAFLVCYAALTFGEDYLNNRLINHGFN